MNDSRFWQRFFILTAIAVAALTVIRVWNVLIPFILGVAIAYLIYPIVDSFVMMGLRRDRVVTVLYSGMLVLFAILVFFVFPLLIKEANSFISELPYYARTLDQTTQQVSSEIQSRLVHILGTKAKTFSFSFNTERFLDEIFKTLPHNLMNIAHGMAWVVIVPFVCFFALSQGKKWIDAVFQWTPSTHVEKLLGLLAEIHAALAGYIRGQMLDALCVGVLTTIGLTLLGIDGAVFLGCLTGLFNVVPFMAPVVGGALALFAGLVQQQSASVLFGIVLLYIGVRMFDDFVFIPFILGHSVHLHPVVMLFAVLAGFELGGLLGLVFAIPVAAVIKVVITVLFRVRDRHIVTTTHVLS